MRTKWTVKKDFKPVTITTGGEGGSFLIRCYSGTQEANAEFTVKACNHHDELVGLVTAFKWWLTIIDTEAGRAFNIDKNIDREATLGNVEALLKKLK
jgi:hypothetical protein